MHHLYGKNQLFLNERQVNSTIRFNKYSEIRIEAVETYIAAKQSSFVYSISFFFFVFFFAKKQYEF